MIKPTTTNNADTPIITKCINKATSSPFTPTIPNISEMTAEITAITQTNSMLLLIIILLNYILKDCQYCFHDVIVPVVIRLRNRSVLAPNSPKNELSNHPKKSLS